MTDQPHHTRYTIPQGSRGLPDVEFEGTILAHVDGRGDRATGSIYWSEFTLYETRGGAWILDAAAISDTAGKASYHNLTVIPATLDRAARLTQLRSALTGRSGKVTPLGRRLLIAIGAEKPTLWID